MNLGRSLSLGTAPPLSERQPPEVDVEKRPGRQQTTGSIQVYTKPLITRVDTILKPIDPSGRPSSVVESPAQLIESPVQAPILLSPVTSRSSASHHLNLAGDHPETTPGDLLEVQVHVPNPPTTISTTPPRALGHSLPLDGTPQPTGYTSANASGVGFRQTVSRRPRQTPFITRTKTAFSEKTYS